MSISQQFSDLNSKFVETVNGHDPRRWAALFSEDAVLIPAGQPSVTGRTGIETWAEGAMKIWNHLEIHDGGSCSTEGDVVWEQGTWSGNINVPDAKETMDISGNFLLVAEKEGAALRIKAHTWSVNSPT